MDMGCCYSEFHALCDHQTTIYISVCVMYIIMHIFLVGYNRHFQQEKKLTVLSHLKINQVLSTVQYYVQV